MTKLLRQHLYVVKSSLGTINDTLTDMEHNQEKVIKGMRQIKDNLEAFTAGE
jgi:dethiobiotin synthetase